MAMVGWLNFVEQKLRVVAPKSKTEQKEGEPDEPVMTEQLESPEPFVEHNWRSAVPTAEHQSGMLSLPYALQVDGLPWALGGSTEQAALLAQDEQVSSVEVPTEIVEHSLPLSLSAEQR